MSASTVLECLNNFPHTSMRAWAARSDFLDQQIKHRPVICWIGIAKIEQTTKVISVETFSGLRIKADCHPSTEPCPDRQPSRYGCSQYRLNKFSAIHMPSQLKEKS